jgi:CrcB protein
LSNFFLVALGGSIGASTRYIFYLISKNLLSPSNLFINTLIVNIIGSFLIGYLIVLLENKSLSQDFIKYFFIIGVLGSFTTFSAFSLETIDLIVNKKILIAFFYIFSSLFLCLLFTFIGLNFNKLIN